MGIDERFHNATRLESIVDWLVQSKLVTRFDCRDGFYIQKGPSVRLKDNTVCDAVDWLLSEGFKAGCLVSGYMVVHSESSVRCSEQLSFIKLDVDAPFYPILEDVDLRERPPF